MTFWADNIKFIKDIQDSKYKKIEDCIAELNEQIATLTTDKDDKKAREHFVEASRTLEIMNMGEIDTLAETMFKDIPDDAKEKKAEMERLAQVKEAYAKAIATIKDSKSKFGLWTATLSAWLPSQMARLIHALQIIYKLIYWQIKGCTVVVVKMGLTAFTWSSDENTVH